MKSNIKYKAFLEMSKHVVNFSKFDFLHRLIFYVEAPLRYLKFKKVYKEEMKAKVEKKEVK